MILKEGAKILILTNTSHYWMGCIIGIDAFCIYLDHASWIPEIGRHHQVLKTGLPDDDTEIEPHPNGMVTAVPRIGSVIMEWPYELWSKPK